MAVTLKPRRSATPGSVPTTAQLADGEMAVNTADRKLYVRAGASVVDLTPSGGGGGTPGGSAGQLQYNSAGAFAGAGKVGVGSTGSLELLADTPPVPTGTAFTLHNREYMGRPSLGVLAPNGELRTMQISLGRNRVMYAQGTWNAGVTGWGIPSVSTQGSAATRVIATTNTATRMRRSGFASAATAGSLAEWRMGTQVVTAGTGATPLDGSGFFMVFRFVPADAATVAGARMFVGLTNSVTAATNVEPSSIGQAIGIAQLSTDATQFYLVYGGTAAQTAIPLGTAVGAPGTLSADAYQLAIYAPATVANTFYVRVRNLRTGVETATQTVTGTGTQVPVNTVALAPRMWRTNNATALAVAIDFVSLYIETEY